VPTDQTELPGGYNGTDSVNLSSSVIDYAVHSFYGNHGCYKVEGKCFTDTIKLQHSQASMCRVSSNTVLCSVQWNVMYENMPP